MTDFLDEKRQEITSRLKELKPLVDEFNRLEAAAAALAGVIGSAASGATAAAAATVTRRRGPGRPRGSSSRKKAAKAAAPKAAAATTTAAAPKAAVKAAARRETTCRTAQRQRHPRRRGALVRTGTAWHHDPRAGRQDGHQAELPLPRAARTRAGREGREERPWLVPEGLVSEPLAASSSRSRAKHTTLLASLPGTPIRRPSPPGYRWTPSRLRLNLGESSDR